MVVAAQQDGIAVAESAHHVSDEGIAGQDPVAFLQRFRKHVSHVHIKDVSPTLAAAARGELTGIAVSHCAIGDGANAENIRRCIELLAEDGYDGVLSMECEGAGGPMIEKSLDWLRGVMERMESRARPSKTDVVPA
jgi:sugar phosphate isomerase/epimerase